MLGKVWSFLSKDRNRKILSWIGGGIVVVISALWVAFVYFAPPSKSGSAPSPEGNVTAECGSAAQRGWSWFSSVTITGSRDCGSAVAEPNKKK